ncbi:MAG: tRNA pseudouridine(55) synthase TruB [Terriglobia bacterium]
MEFSGVLIIDKPAGITSHDVVSVVRRLLQIRQVGHFGTLDPFATGVLPTSVGKATRFAQFYLKSRKAYDGVIDFSFSTDTYDATGELTSQPAPGGIERIGRAALEKVFRDFTGRLAQVPPPFSAKRVGGVRAYELARAHKPVDLAPVEVEIYAVELLGVEGDRAHFAVECSGGTYVRSLAYDIGRTIDCPAHLASLRRTAVAEFREAQMVSLEGLEKAVVEGKLEGVSIPLEALLPDCPELVVRGREEKSVRHGHTFELAPMAGSGRGSRAGGPTFSLLKIMSYERRLIAIARHVEGNIYHPDLVLV